MSGTIASAFTIRNVSDYDAMFIANKDETAEQITNEEWVHRGISEYVEGL